MQPNEPMSDALLADIRQAWADNAPTYGRELLQEVLRLRAENTHRKRCSDLFLAEKRVAEEELRMLYPVLSSLSKHREKRGTTAYYAARTRYELAQALGMPTDDLDLVPKFARDLRAAQAALRHEINTLRARDASKTRTELRRERDEALSKLKAMESHDE